MPRSHAEIAGAMPAYASGILTGRAEAVVRRHLASGCRECLATLFRHPVGLPRDERRERAEPPPDDGAWSVVTAILLVIALTGTVVASTVWLGDRPAARSGDDGARRRAAALETRVAETRGLLASLSARASRLEADLGSLPGPRGSNVGHASRPPGARDGTARALGRLGSSLASPATRVERLRPGATAAGARGWLVWDPLRRRIFVYAMGLPGLVAPWEAVIEVGDGARRAPLTRLEGGGAWAALEPLADEGCRAAVVVVPPGADRVVLRGDLDVCPAGPAA